MTMIATATLRFVFYDAGKFEDSFYSIFSIYLIFFGIMLYGAEYKWIWIMKYFEFLASDLGKSMFILFIGVLLFDQNKFFDLVASIALTIMAFLNCIYICA